MNWVISTIIYAMLICVGLNAVIYGIFKATHKEDK